MAQNDTPRKALVLAGGGARGSYQVGVWRALTELGWNPQIIWHRRNNADFALQWVRSEICLWFKKHPPMNPEMMLEDENRHR